VNEPAFIRLAPLQHDLFPDAPDRYSEASFYLFVFKPSLARLLGRRYKLRDRVQTANDFYIFTFGRARAFPGHSRISPIKETMTTLSPQPVHFQLLLVP
jgi:hypothetical protein